MSQNKILVLLSGSGVYDGSEIHESVLTLLAIQEAGATYQCAAPNIIQHHVIDHTSGEEMAESRNVLVESARIARGEILDLKDVTSADYDALLMPGGFGAAKNWSSWAFEGPEGTIDEEVKRIIREFHRESKPIGALCMSPTVVSRAFKEDTIETELTVGTTEQASPYDIGAITQGMESIGAHAKMVVVDEIHVDEANKIVTCPCYMMEANIADIRAGAKKTVDKVLQLI